MRVAVIFHRVGPYHGARLEAAGGVGEVEAIELSGETGEYAWTKVLGAKGYRRRTLFPDMDSRTASAREIEWRVAQALRETAAEVVAIPGWSDRGSLAALKWCCATRTRAVLMSESTAHDEPRRWWKERMKRRIVGLYSTALVGGRAHAAYLHRLGMNLERIFTGYDVVDNAHFARRPEPLQNIRSPYFLASARFIPKKNLETLLRAYAAYREAAGSSAWNLVLLGDGPLRPVLEAEISSLDLGTSVVLPGFQQYDELPAYYAHASAFVHASTAEPWGLVVNEAIAASLPVIVSERCGCVPELVQNDVNGWTFDPRDTRALTNCLARMSALSPLQREQFSQASRTIAAEHGPDKFAEGLMRAAAAALKLPPPSPVGVVTPLLLNCLLHR